MTWPPTVADLKVDLKIDPNDDRDNARLASDLAAAVALVERVRGGAFKFDPADPAQWALPDPTDDIFLGTLRLAGRWTIRRRSPDGMVAVSAEMGSARVASFDADIDRLLGIGRHRGPVFA
jgi:hypothetical protein